MPKELTWLKAIYKVLTSSLDLVWRGRWSGAFSSPQRLGKTTNGKQAKIACNILFEKDAKALEYYGEAKMLYQRFLNYFVLSTFNCD